MLEGFKVDAVVNAENAEYHRHLKRGEFRLQRCSGCGFIRQPASWICPECLSEEFSWQPMSGRATVQTFIWYFEDVLDKRYVRDWAWRDVPYNVAIVKLDEGPQLITNIDDVSFEELRAGMIVSPKYVEVSTEYAILRFVPS
jgi:uncharacterized OB-fold protein